MIVAFLAAVAVSISAPQAAEQQTPPNTAGAPPQTSGVQDRPNRQVCRFETTIGSNRRVRVCRDVSRQNAQDQATREFMRDNQRIRTPDGG